MAFGCVPWCSVPLLLCCSAVLLLCDWAAGEVLRYAEVCHQSSQSVLRVWAKSISSSNGTSLSDVGLFRAAIDWPRLLALKISASILFCNDSTGDRCFAIIRRWTERYKVSIQTRRQYL